jgi:uncharacterized membrane protein
MQLWATWIVYAVLIELTDAVAEELRQPFAALSVEMVYRELYHFTQARQHGNADDAGAYLAAQVVVAGACAASSVASGAGAVLTVLMNITPRY